MTRLASKRHSKLPVRWRQSQDWEENVTEGEEQEQEQEGEGEEFYLTRFATQRVNFVNSPGENFANLPPCWMSVPLRSTSLATAWSTGCTPQARFVIVVGGRVQFRCASRVLWQWKSAWGCVACKDLASGCGSICRGRRRGF